jgi:hypothetical protein
MEIKKAETDMTIYLMACYINRLAKLLLLDLT